MICNKLCRQTVRQLGTRGLDDVIKKVLFVIDRFRGSWCSSTFYFGWLKRARNGWKGSTDRRQGYWFVLVFVYLNNK